MGFIEQFFQMQFQSLVFSPAKSSWSIIRLPISSNTFFCLYWSEKSYRLHLKMSILIATYKSRLTQLKRKRKT